MTAGNPQNLREGAGGVYRDILGFFNQSVLAKYRSEPDKYIIETDNFEGHVKVTDSYYEECEAAGSKNAIIDVRFGYRTLSNGDLAVAAFLPDLFRKSSSHVRVWQGFFIENPEWASDPDERFEMWVQRYLEGSWDIESGPRYHLKETLKTINALTIEVLDQSLFNVETEHAPNFPLSQNSHRYLDAHQELYGYLIDSLNRDCIAQIAGRAGQVVKVGDKRTIKALEEANLLPAMLKNILDKISEQRRQAAHKMRPPAQKMAAFEEFNRDLDMCVRGLRELLTLIEPMLGMMGKHAHRRQEAKRYMPKIDQPSKPNFAINRIRRAVGKTIERVEYGFRKEIKGVHQSEAMILYFTDGSILGIDTGSNAWNLSNDRDDMEPEDVHVDLNLQWVPGPSENNVDEA